MAASVRILTLLCDKSQNLAARGTWNPGPGFLTADQYAIKSIVVLDFIDVMVIARIAPFHPKTGAALKPAAVTAYGHPSEPGRRPECAADCCSKNKKVSGRNCSSQNAA